MGFASRSYGITRFGKNVACYNFVSRSRLNVKDNWSNDMVQFSVRRQFLTHKTLNVLQVYEDTLSGNQLFQVHEIDPLCKIDRIVYREKSRAGWFKEIDSEDYFKKVKSSKQVSPMYVSEGE